jgi:hypothetical protein
MEGLEEYSPDNMKTNAKVGPFIKVMSVKWW